MGIFGCKHIFGQDGSYNKLWNEVKKAQAKDQPKSVISICDKILDKAQKENNRGQMLKAYFCRAEYNTRITPDSTYSNMANLEKMAAEEKDPIAKMVLHSCIAFIYADYAKSNAYALARRTNIEGTEDTPDVKQWGSIKFTKTIIDNVNASLDDTEALLNCDNSSYIPFVYQGSASKYYKHNMLHILVKRACSSLKLATDIAIDKQAIRNRITEIQDIEIAAYRNNGNTEAYILSSLNKIKSTKGTISASKYIADLEALMSEEQVKANDLSVEILIELIPAIMQDSPARAMELCNHGIENYSGYSRTSHLKQFKKEILAPMVELSIPGLAYPGEKQDISVTHKNSDNIKITFYQIPESIRQVIETDRYYNLTDKDLKQCKEYSTQIIHIERPADYKPISSIVKLDIPKDNGIYTYKIEAASEKVFRGDIIRVSRLYAINTSWEPQKLEAIVLDRKSGNPIEGATLLLEKKLRESSNKKEVSSLVSNKDGKVCFDIDLTQCRSDATLKVELGEDKYLPERSVFIRSREQDLSHKKNYRLNIITDRSIYRPGQIVYVKGLYYTEQGDSANVLKNRILNIILRNTNREVVDTKKVTSNDFGSFNTTLNIPASGLMGLYTVECQEYRNAAIDIRVEEYKRPTFETQAESPKGTFKIGDSVEVAAFAKTFSGVPVSNADVKYVITRSLNNMWNSISDEIIEEGDITADENGYVRIPVSLIADDQYNELGADIQERRYNRLHYCFTVDISFTNAAGETQSTSARIFASNTSMLISYTGSDQINKDKDITISIGTYNLSHAPVDTKVSYELWSLENGEKKEKVINGSIKSNTRVTMPEWKILPSGKYRIEYSATDDKGKICNGDSEIYLFSTTDTKLATKLDLWTYKDNENIYFGTSNEDATIFLDIYANNKNVRSEVIKISDKILHEKFIYLPEYGDGARMLLKTVRNGVLSTKEFTVTKPHEPHSLKLTWNVFRNKLIPGQKEEWKMSITTADGKPADAEILALMYDASLNSIYPHQISRVYHSFPRALTSVIWEQPTPYRGASFYINPVKQAYVPSMYFDYFISIPRLLEPRRYYLRSRDGAAAGSIAPTSRYEEYAVSEESVEYIVANDVVATKSTASDKDLQANPNQGATSHQIRTNFNETAFFYPNLVTDESGTISIKFTLPESLTKWSFFSMAHTKDLMTGYLTDEIEAKKDFMISPFMPRFLRTGDNASIASSLINLSDKNITANVRFELFDLASEKVFHTQRKKVSAGAGKTVSVSFGFLVEDTYDVIGVRIVAEGGQFSDGEQHVLAVLPDKVRLVESVALPIRGNQTKTFSLEKLFNHHSHTATKKTLTIEFTGNPAWYAVQALPSMATPEDDCAICWSNTLYANVLASQIANSQPKIKNVYESWKKSGQDKETLLSNLQKNQELKTILLSESPWVLEAKSEKDQKNMISTLFDIMSIGNTKELAIKKLQELQMADGGWTWFKGMQSSPWITEYILTQDIRLQILTGEKMDSERSQMHSKGLKYMHNAAQEEYDDIKKYNRKTVGVSYFILKYLYLISLEAQANNISNPMDLIPANRLTMYKWFLNKVGEAPSFQDMQEKALSAVVFNAHGKNKLAGEYMQSIKEHLTGSEEMGMYFAFNENPYRWGSLNLNAQVAAIEAFDQVAKDKQTVEEMKIWLLKQKQTQMWQTSVLTADAVFALLARGENWLASEGEVSLSFASRTLNTTKPDEEGNSPIMGLNYIKRAYTDSQTIGAKDITVQKNDKGIAWGAAYATFFESLENVKENGSKEMSISKELFVKRTNKVSEAASASTQALAFTLEPLKDGAKVKVGEIVTARMVIKIDRSMDFVQLKEQRAACFEPLNQLSGYRYNAGLGFYQEFKDASTNFFFYSLGKGTYVLEVNYRVSRAGEYEAGLATLQCAYAPEYTAHTKSCRITVVE